VRLNKITAPAVLTFQDQLGDGCRPEAMVRRVTASLGSVLADAQARGLVRSRNRPEGGYGEGHIATENFVCNGP
jgi:hypothetical protein